MNPYIGHDLQLCGIEEYRLIGGKGDGMRLLQVRNGLGLELTISLDRAADITRLTYRGINMSYMAPCGYVAPAYYESTGINFLKSFTAGFLTTCGLQSVGSPCTDEGEVLPLHGSIGNTPAEQVYFREEADELVITAQINDEGLFARKLRLIREIKISLKRNEFTLNDRIENRGDIRTPVEILYHMNMGYPLLDEDSIVEISTDRVIPRNEHAAEDITNWMIMEKPQKQYEERCYYHECSKVGQASIYQPKLNAGLRIHFDPKQLDCFTQWKMMGHRDYVLGLEPGNCYPDGRDVMRKDGRLKFADPGECIGYSIRVEMMD